VEASGRSGETAEGGRGAPRAGAWIVGAAGNVAACLATGWAALRRGLIEPIGLLTESAPLARLPLAPLDGWVLGGHEVRARTVRETADVLASERVVRADLPARVAEDLAALQAEVRPGVAAVGSGDELARVRDDLASFRQRHGLARVVVLHLATTEPPWAPPAGEAPPDDPDALLGALRAGQLRLPPSALYAAAALDLGMGFVNFTPSVGSDLPALHALAQARGAVHAGADGKTGETLVKTALAPMFDVRRLRVRSWFGQNVLGNGDGEALAQSDRRASKQRTKGAALAEILGYAPESHVGIDFLRSFGDWKVAWDHIAFEGFGGAQMSMQFTWQGCDSALAAPLCLDLLRLCELAARRGEKGALAWLALFFKAPLGTREQRLGEQYRLLLEHFAPELPA
jgi:myo-inositol-1-phosphate synthase